MFDWVGSIWDWVQGSIIGPVETMIYVALGVGGLALFQNLKGRVSGEGGWFAGASARTETVAQISAAADADLKNDITEIKMGQEFIKRDLSALGKKVDRLESDIRYFHYTPGRGGDGAASGYNGGGG